MNRMKGKKDFSRFRLLLNSQCGRWMFPTCPRNTLSDRNRPTLSDDGILQCFRCLEYAIHRALATGETNQIADWLFSTENDANGQPKGIGLSLWRFNVGAGSTEQGENSQMLLPGCVPNVS